MAQRRKSNDQRDEASRRLILLRRPPAISRPVGSAEDGRAPRLGPVVVWNATKTCNLECIHCYADAATQRFANELTTSEARAMIEDLAAMQVPALLMSGGEPLVRPDIFDLAEYATSLGVRVTFSTNGTLIDERKAQRIADIGVTYVGISVDGDEKRHDRMRRHEGAFRDALRGVRNCRDAGIRVGVRFTVTQDNVNEIDSVFRVVEKESIGRLCLYHLVYSGRGSYLEGIDLEAAQKRVLMNKLLEQVEKWNAEGREIEVMTVDNHADAPFIYYWLLDRDPQRADYALSLMRNNGGNRSGIAIAAIDSFGFVHPDQFTSTHAVGSIRERPFSTIWRDSEIELLENLRDRKPLLAGPLRNLPVAVDVQRKLPGAGRGGDGELLGIRPRVLPARFRDRVGGAGMTAQAPAVAERAPLGSMTAVAPQAGGIDGDVPISPNDPINRRILEVSEDRVRGFVRDPIRTIAELSSVPMPVVVQRIRAMLEAGTIRRVRQTLLATNLAQGALVAWKIDERLADARSTSLRRTILFRATWSFATARMVRRSGASGRL